MEHKRADESLTGLPYKAQRARQRRDMTAVVAACQCLVYSHSRFIRLFPPPPGTPSSSSIDPAMNYAVPGGWVAGRTRLLAPRVE